MSQFGLGTYQALSGHWKLVAGMWDSAALANGPKAQVQPRENTRSIRGGSGVPGKLAREGPAPTKLSGLEHSQKERIFPLQRPSIVLYWVQSSTHRKDQIHLSLLPGASTYQRQTFGQAMSEIQQLFDSSPSTPASSEFPAGFTPVPFPHSLAPLPFPSISLTCT